MKQTFTIICLWILLLPLASISQTFEPAGYILQMDKPARVMKSHLKPDSIILHTVSTPYDMNEPGLKELVSQMYRTVIDSLSRGVGIAAPQIGVNKRVIIVQRFDKPEEPFEAYVNPTIIQYSNLKALRNEGCLSIENCREVVERSYAILLSYYTVKGEFKLEMVEDFTARIFQHEIDHLDGILFTSRLNK